ncbi:MAG TPA: ankyrin repeat domain-containing protein [Oculatellaceae cyanobacterium]|jgi:ankyrin repeat protein
MSQLNSAIRAGDVAKVRQLITNSHANLKETFGTIALAQAADLGHLEIIQVLIEVGAEVNDEDRVLYPHEIPLARAASQGHLQVVQVLLDAGAEVNIPVQDPEYWTPLMCAVNNGNIKVVKLLVDAGANVDEIRGGGNFALMIAAHSKNWEIFEFLAPLTNSILRQEAEKVF